MILWGYLSFFAVQDLRVAPLKDTSNLPLWKRLLYKEGQYKNAISVLSLAVGCAILFISLSYPRRAIKSLWLLKGGQEVKITTFSPFGKENTFIKPILHINCLEARTGAGPYIPLQIKDKYFFFLLDKKGQFHNTNLFDFLIGIKRKI
ncbi:transmembrane protein 223 [Biomphalaria glabrata]|nr:transmembrane protein 223-like [Biomphalaria glabrata]KAI8788308.1 transmembrane protein 223 [Biomphalaria glabrata]